MSLADDSNAAWRPLFVRAIALRWYSAHPHDPLVSVDVYFFREITTDTGSMPIEKRLLFHSDSPMSGV